MTDRFVGIDAGGSRTTAVVVDAMGVELGRSESGPSGFQEDGPEVAAGRIGALVAEVLGEGGSTPKRLVCAMAGGGSRGPANELRRRLTSGGVSDDVAVVTDADAALHAVFGDGPGIVLIAGTGSIAIGRGPDGRAGRAGGSLPPGGDPGSGEWLGRLGIRAAMRGGGAALGAAVVSGAGVPEASRLVQFEQSASRAQVARIAQKVVDAADSGDTEAAVLVGRAGTELARLVVELEAELGPWREAARVALSGGLLEPGRRMREVVISSLERGAAVLDVVSGRVDAPLGAALLAVRGGFGEGEGT